MKLIYRIIFIVFIFANCKKIAVPDPYSDGSENISTQENKPYLCIVWQPSQILNTNKFLKSYTISRFFFII